MTLRVEAIDTYGAAFNDLDKHSATEEFSLEIVEDQPPAIVIGQPQDQSDITEGDYLDFLRANQRHRDKTQCHTKKRKS